MQRGRRARAMMTGVADEGGSDTERGGCAPADDATIAVGPSSSTTKATRASSPASDERAAPSGIFGRYKLEERIGAGGMGLVYRAYDPMLERAVALKIVRSQRGGEDGQRRLFREAQVLAQVRHPNVVAVYDVGALGKDVFVAMELVQGTPMSEWQKDRDSREIIRAYGQAGRGLAAAHDRGLVHRDVKPDNILVGDDGRVTVIDFGLAAVDEDSLGDDHDSLTPTPDRYAEYTSQSSFRTRLTQVGCVMGTPRYMSPEQHVAGGRIDVHSDQYSFALALYEALTKTWPFVKDPAIRNTVDALRAAKDRAVFAAPARALSAHLRRTLQRALVANSTERFPSMTALLEQVEKDPARKLRRFFAAAGIVASLGVASWSAIAGNSAGSALCQGAGAELATTWNPERRDAVKAAFFAPGVHYASATFDRVASVLDEYGEQWTEMRTNACAATHIQGVQSDTVLDLRMGCLNRKRRVLEALLAVFVGTLDRDIVDKAVEASLGLGEIAYCADINALEQEVEPPERTEDRQILAKLRGQLDDVGQLDKLGKYRTAESLLNKMAAEVADLSFPPLQAEFAYYRALILSHLGKYTDAEPPLITAIDLGLNLDMRELASKAGALATYVVGYSLQRHAEGLIYAQHARSLARNRGDAVEADVLSNLASIYYAQGRYDETEVVSKRALNIRESTFGRDHPIVANSLNHLAVLYFAQGKYAQSEQHHKRALAIWNRVLGPEHPSAALSLNNLANLYSVQGKHAQAEEFLERALAIRTKALGDRNPDVAVLLHNLAACYRDQDKHQEADKLDLRALEIFQETHGPKHAYVAYPLVALGEHQEDQRRYPEALRLLKQAKSIRDKAKVAPRERAEVNFALARVIWSIGTHRSAAQALAREALALYNAAGPGSDEERVKLEQWLSTHR